MRCDGLSVWHASILGAFAMWPVMIHSLLHTLLAAACGCGEEKQRVSLRLSSNIACACCVPWR